MPWFRVDDTLAWHSKIVRVGNAATGLWTRAGSWSMQQLTDGFIPADIARSLGSDTEIRKLVDAGLWTRADGGYRFHEWDERQPSKAQVLAERRTAAERQKRAREAAKKNREESGNVTHLSRRESR